jgi:Domain of unknown function (DUF1330)
MSIMTPAQSTVWWSTKIKRKFEAFSAGLQKASAQVEIARLFIVFTKESTQDQNELNIYHSKVRETLEGHPVKLHAGPQQVLEGPVPEAVVILEFPTTTAAANGMTARRIRR